MKAPAGSALSGLEPYISASKGASLMDMQVSSSVPATVWSTSVRQHLL
ncbi:hypothetical protein [Duncaniella dubosii]|nr:hypothetical protein [Duncaniella dubosii]